MWCRDCKQDVPVLFGAGERRACPRCGAGFLAPELEAAADGVSCPNDAGISLDSLDPAPRLAAIDAAAGDRAAAELRRIGRKLRCVPHGGVLAGDAPGWAPPSVWPTSEQLTPPVSQPPLAPPAMQRGGREPALSASIELLLAVGVMTLLAGMGCLAWAAADGPEVAGTWGMPAAIAGQSLLLLGLARLVARLWRSSGRMSQQLDGVDRQIHALRRLPADSTIAS